MLQNGTFVVMEEDVVVTLEEQTFNGNVREAIISIILSIVLGLAAYFVLNYYKKSRDKEDLYGSEREDELVYRISIAMCTISLATSFAAILLLPFSVIGNEIIHLHPNNYYIKWLTSSLVQGLWNKVFFVSNVSLFIFLPFAYLFMESSGFSGSRRGILSRVKETMVMMFLLGILAHCLAWLTSAIFNGGRSSGDSEAWNFYFPEVYSWISIFGVSVLLFFTPVGLTIMFTEVGRYVIRPQFFQDINQELAAAQMDVDFLLRHQGHYQQESPLVNGALINHERLQAAQRNLDEIERRSKTPSVMRNLSYPLTMALLSLLTFASIVMVGLNVLELLFDRKALPTEAQNVILGKTSLSAFGFYGVLFEIAIIFYILVASLAGLYSKLPQLRPTRQNTDMSKIIFNCGVFVILSSALPVLSRILGISNFDLLGAFGRQPWLSNIYLILVYNAMFGFSATMCLVNKFSLPMREAMYKKLMQPFVGERRPHSDSHHFD